MSHFTVTVALPGGTPLDKVPDLLADILAPWDEKTKVDPYRVYEEGGPADYWWVKHVRESVEHLANGTGLKPCNPDMFASFSTAETRETPEEQREAFARNAEWAKRLGDDPTWELVVELYTERFPDDSDSERPQYDPKNGRAYTVSTYNPDSKWDYFVLGGRAAGRFLAKSADADVLKSKKAWNSPANAEEPLRCNGGRVGDLDLEGMRNAAEVKAFGEYRTWETLLAQHPAARPWSHFHDLAKVGELTWDQARKQYRDQPLIQATDDRAMWEVLGTDPLGCPLAHFALPRAEFVEAARIAAVSGYALVTLDREWVAPGRMGMFGVSSDSDEEMRAYRVVANRYISALAEDTVLTIVDCHI
jgi:hypothetical protein